MSASGIHAQLAWIAYLAWLAAGCADFAFHRRTDLPHTSGLAESTLHLLQLALIGTGIALWLLFEPAVPVLAAMLALVLAHAIVGYVDTRVAYGRRPIGPGEQHVHSILDMAPWIALAWASVASWNEATANGWRLALRDPQAGIGVWTAVVVPALLACGWPALSEWRRSLAAARSAGSAA